MKPAAVWGRALTHSMAPAPAPEANRLRRLLRRVEDEHRSLVIEKRGTPRAVLLSIRDYVRLAAPEPEVLRFMARNRSARVLTKRTSRQVDQVIKATRA